MSNTGMYFLDFDACPSGLLFTAERRSYGHNLHPAVAVFGQARLCFRQAAPSPCPGAAWNLSGSKVET